MHISPLKLVLTTTFLQVAFCWRGYVGTFYTGPSKEQNTAEWLGCTSVSSDFNDYVNSIKLGDNSLVHVFFKDYNCKSSYLIVPKGNVDLSDLSYYGFNNQISSFYVSKTAPPCQWKCGDLCCGDA